MPLYYVDCDERYPDYDISDKKVTGNEKVVELTEEEAKAFVASKILYNYWQRIIGERETTDWE